MEKGLHVMVGNPDELWQRWLLWPASPLPDEVTAFTGEGKCVSPQSAASPLEWALLWGRQFPMSVVTADSSGIMDWSAEVLVQGPLEQNSVSSSCIAKLLLAFPGNVPVPLA